MTLGLTVTLRSVTFRRTFVPNVASLARTPGDVERNLTPTFYGAGV